MALVNIEQVSGHVPVTIFHLQEKIDLRNFAELEQAAQKAMDGGMHDLVIDMSKSELLTSIGIRALVIVHKMLSKDGAKHLKLAEPTEHIREVLQIAGITQFIDIYDSVDEAVASF
jgi:anti-anti-sigma factor